MNINCKGCSYRTTGRVRTFCIAICRVIIIINKKLVFYIAILFTRWCQPKGYVFTCTIDYVRCRIPCIIWSIYISIFTLFYNCHWKCIVFCIRRISPWSKTSNYSNVINCISKIIVITIQCKSILQLIICN